MGVITQHQVNEVNNELFVRTLDAPGAGGAHHVYEISGGWNRLIVFQNGPIKDKGFNGLTQEVLLAIIADRLRGFQSGPFACDENAKALEHVEAALLVLKSRTLARQARGVEGTHVI